MKLLYLGAGIAANPNYPQTMLRPHKPKLGQNFLIDQQAGQSIAAALGDLTQRTVIEIGPGRGAITDILAPRCRRLILIELDSALAAELRHRFRDRPSVEVIEADILEADLATLIPTSETASVIGNLPYYITSDILLKLFANASLIDRAVLMMQREVAIRVAAPPGSSDHGLLSATTQLYATVEPLFTLSPAAFSPPPEVYSTVLRLEFAPRFAELAVDPATFIPFLRQLFAQKRKTMRNNLRAAGWSATQIEACWPEGIADEARTESLALPQLAQLYRALNCS